MNKKYNIVLPHLSNPNEKCYFELVIISLIRIKSLNLVQMKRIDQ